MCEMGTHSTGYIIDLSTPETLERDFYAWLKGDGSRGSQIKLEQDCASPRLPSIRQLGEFIGHGLSDLCRLSPVEHMGYSHTSYPFLQDEQMLSECDDSGSPAPSSIASSVSANSPVSYTSIASADSGCPQQLFDLDDKADLGAGATPAGKLKMSSRFANSVNGRSSGTNQLGRTYSPGLPLSMADREQIVGLYQSGWKICDISKKLCVTHSCVSKILNRFRLTGSVRPKDAKESRVESPLVAAIRDYRYRLGMTRQSEIREQLIVDGICRRDNVPSRSSINHILRTKLDLKRTPKKKDVDADNNENEHHLQLP